MEELVIAKAKNVRGSARKARIPARVVTGMMVEEALPILQYMPKKAAADVYKVVHSAKANALNNHEKSEETLMIKSVRVDEGYKLKRHRAGSRGNAKMFDKKFCNITVELIDLSDDESMAEKKTKTKKEVSPKKAETKAKKTVKKVKAEAKTTKKVTKKKTSTKKAAKTK